MLPKKLNVESTKEQLLKAFLFFSVKKFASESLFSLWGWEAGLFCLTFLSRTLQPGLLDIWKMLYDQKDYIFW